MRTCLCSPAYPPLRAAGRCGPSAGLGDLSVYAPGLYGPALDTRWVCRQRSRPTHGHPGMGTHGAGRRYSSLWAKLRTASASTTIPQPADQRMYAVVGGALALNGFPEAARLLVEATIMAAGSRL